MLSRVLLIACLLISALTNADGLTGYYYEYSGTPETQAFSGSPTLTRVDATINFNWGLGSPHASVSGDDFAVYWTGDIEFTSTGNWTFRTVSDDGVRLYIDWNRDGDFSDANESVISNWNDHSSTTDTSSAYNVTTTGRYPIRIEYYENGGFSVMQFQWDTPAAGTSFVTVPTGNLHSNSRPILTGLAQNCGVSNSLILTFNESLNSTDVQTVSNYTLSNGATVTSATLTAGSTSSITLTTSALTYGTSYTITVSNIRDTAGTAMSTTSKSVSIASTSLGAGLDAIYYGQNNTQRAYFTGTPITQVDSIISYNWGAGQPMFGAGPDDFSAVWSGYVRPPSTGNYTFYTYSDDGIRLYVNNQLVIDKWVDQSATEWGSTSMSLTGGSYVPIRVEYYERGGDAVVELRWAGPGLAKQVISSSYLFRCQASSLASLSISTGSSASTCTPQNVTISARDAGGNVLPGYTGTVQLSTSSAHGNWAKVTANGTLSPASDTDDNGSVSYTFASSDSGSATLSLANDHADDLQIAASDSTSGISATSSQIQFRDNTFVIKSIDSLLEDVVAGRSHALRAEFWKKDTTTGNCSIATTYTGSKNLKAWITRDAADPAGAAPALAGTSLPNSAPASNNLTTSFSAGIANLNLTTTDTGRYVINLRDDSSGFSVTQPSGSRSISGSSNSLVARPFGFAIDFSSDRATNGNVNAAASYANSATDSPYFKKAGQTFATTIRAVAWQTADDSNGDGLPDSGAILHDNTTTTSFNAATTLSPTLVLPSGGTTGTISGGNSLTGFSSGSLTSNISYSEVGIIDISALSSNYLSSGRNISGTVSNVGRFVPDHFLLNGFLLYPGCNTFTYMGQTFSVSLDFSARNASNTVTQNYHGSFARINLTSSSAMQATLTESLTPPLLATNLNSRLQWLSSAGGTITNGQSTWNRYDFSVSRNPTPDGPYEYARIAMKPVDNDGITVASTALNMDSDGDLTVDRQMVGTFPIRYGRLFIDNASGSELLPLSMPMQAQYWKSVGSSTRKDFQTNTDDNCTTLSITPAASPVWGSFTLGSWTDNLQSGETWPTGVTAFINGKGSVTLRAPGNGNTGSVKVTLGAPNWLKYDFDKNISGDENPSARATFGLYQGRKPIIFWRETFR